jgi:prepilin-type N-terminal cleavage/methylation domain-containing protein
MIGARASGFTLLELLVSIALLLTVTGGIFTVMHPSTGIFQAQPEVSDVQQRLRTGVDALRHDLLMAGAGAYAGTQSGPLNGFIAAVIPARQGRLAALDDGPGGFRSDGITILSVPRTASQATLAAALATASAPLVVQNEPGCPLGRPVCGLEPGMQALIFNDWGASDVVTITGIHGNGAIFHTNHRADLSTTYLPGAKVVEIRQRVYFLDEPASRLMRYDGHLSSVPVLDNVAALEFEYYGNPDPPALQRPGIDQTMTYGPQPPAVDASINGHAPGENCVIEVRNGEQVPRLAALGVPGSGLVRLVESQLIDGPWCPNDLSPTRFDADLLRVRLVRTAIRVQTGNRSAQVRAAVPDQAIRFDTAPRNLGAGR